MPRINAVLKHAQKDEIHKALQRSEAYRSVAEHYDISPSAVYRYKVNFVTDKTPGVDTPETKQAGREASDAVVKGFQSIAEIHADWIWAKRELKDIVTKAKKTGKDPTRAVEAVSKLATDRMHAYMKYAELRQENTPLEDMPEYREQVTKILIALEPYSEARIAVAEALNE